jgi:hypothetical protein
MNKSFFLVYVRVAFKNIGLCMFFTAKTLVEISHYEAAFLQIFLIKVLMLLPLIYVVA